MLKYFYQVTEALLLVAALSGVLFGYAGARWDKRGMRIVGAGCLLGWAVALVIGVLRIVTINLIDSGAWNLRYIAVFLVGFVLFYVLAIPALAAKLADAAERARQVGAALMLAGTTAYFGIEPVMYPNTILNSVKSVVSTDFFYRIVGWLLGLLLVFLLAFATYKVIVALAEDRLVTFAAHLVPLAAAAELIGLGLRAMLTRRIIPQNHTVFQVAVFVSNHHILFGLIAAALAVCLAAVLFARSLRVNEPYDNPAQRRKIKAKWRNRRRWATCALVCAAISLANVTAVKAYDSREVELSPSEDCELRDDGCYIPFSQVEDGNLHRFTYESPSGVGIRFIIIKKPGGSSYGIGLDACDICGETGYYQRDDQVVCKLCDVVMNVQTIGFKGGCNPIVIDYSVRDGYIIVPYETLLEHEDIFTR